MRVIKFRIWNGKETDYFVLGNEFDCHSGWLDDSILEQFTGLTDKNGRDIYEGDIAVWETVSLRKRIVEFIDYCFAMTWISKYDEKIINVLQNIKSNEIEIIGNIHENESDN